jgi:hypothetical protein
MDWKKEFHIHVDTSSITLDIVLAQSREGKLDHPTRRKFSTAEKNYKMIERGGLEMLYALQKFRNYFLGCHFNMYKNHYAL